MLKLIVQNVKTFNVVAVNFKPLLNLIYSVKQCAEIIAFFKADLLFALQNSVDVAAVVTVKDLLLKSCKLLSYFCK